MDRPVPKHAFKPRAAPPPAKNRHHDDRPGAVARSAHDGPDRDVAVPGYRLANSWGAMSLR
jgi:hypothetical protein